VGPLRRSHIHLFQDRTSPWRDAGCQLGASCVLEDPKIRNALGKHEPAVRSGIRYSGMSKQQPRVEVRLSTRRRKTATAFWQGGQIVVVVPARASRAARDQLVDDLVRKVRNRRPMLSASDRELTQRARQLAGAYIPQAQPSSVRWVGNQHHQWGSCTPLTGEIRISERLRPVPAWVLDGVLVHELAHLIEPTHSAAFRSLVGLYPKSKEADAFLAGLALGLDLLVNPAQ